MTEDMRRWKGGEGSETAKKKKRLKHETRPEGEEWEKREEERKGEGKGEERMI